MRNLNFLYMEGILILKHTITKIGLREPHGKIELYILRIAFALVAVWKFPFQPNFPDQPLPNGLAQYFDFTVFSAYAPWWPMYVGLAIALVLYCWGRLMLFATGYLLVMTVGAGTFYNS